MKVGLVPGHIVLDGDPAPHVCCRQAAGWITMPLLTEVGLDPGHIVLDGNQAPPRKVHTSPHFSAHVCCGQTVAHLSNC